MRRGSATRPWPGAARCREPGTGGSTTRCALVFALRFSRTVCVWRGREYVCHGRKGDAKHVRSGEPPRKGSKWRWHIRGPVHDRPTVAAVDGCDQRRGPALHAVLRGLAHRGELCGEFGASTYGDRRLWITFLRRFWVVFWGGFLEPIGPGASARADFSADGVLLVRWASANFDFFRGFFAFLVRFLPVFVPFFALFPSMPCAYLYVHNFPPTRVSRSRGRGIRGRRGNLAFDKETVLEGR